MMNVLRKKFPFFQSNPRLAVFFGISSSVFIIGFILFILVSLLSSTEIAMGQDIQPVSVRNKKDPILEVHMANNGMAFLQGVLVEYVSSTKIIVSTAWGSTKIQWILNTNESYYSGRHFGTSFLDSKGNNISARDIKVGDIITASGMLDSKATELTLKADVIRRSY
jgi:hypothetical protein